MKSIDQYVTRRFYCAQCHSEIDFNQVEVRRGFDIVRLESWCDKCRDPVSVTTCKVPYWAIVATIALFVVQLY